MQNLPWFNLDGLAGLVLAKAGPETSQCARIIRPDSGRTQPAHYSFPTFRLGCFLPQTAWILLSKSSPDLIWFWLTVSGFGQTGPVWKQAGVQESPGLITSGQCFYASVDQMHIRSSVFPRRAARFGHLSHTMSTSPSDNIQQVLNVVSNFESPYYVGNMRQLGSLMNWIVLRVCRCICRNYVVV